MWGARGLWLVKAKNATPTLHISYPAVPVAMQSMWQNIPFNIFLEMLLLRVLGLSTRQPKMAESYDPDELVTCPYDPVHRLQRKRMPYHIVKCKKVSTCETGL